MRREREQAAHQAAPREVHQVRLRARRDVRPLVVAGPVAAGADPAALVATFAETAVPQRPRLRRPVHRVAGAADPARLRVLARRDSRPSGPSPAGRGPCRRPWTSRRGRGSTAGRSRRRRPAGSSSPPSRSPRSRRRATSGAGRGRSRRRSSRPAGACRSAVQRQVGPVVLPRAHADRMPALADGRARGDLPRGVADLAGIGSRAPASPPVSAAGAGRDGERLRAVGAVAGRADARSSPVPRWRQVVRRPLDGGLRRVAAGAQGGRPGRRAHQETRAGVTRRGRAAVGGIGRVPAVRVVAADAADAAAPLAPAAGDGG